MTEIAEILIKHDIGNSLTQAQVFRYGKETRYYPAARFLRFLRLFDIRFEYGEIIIDPMGIYIPLVW